MFIYMCENYFFSPKKKKFLKLLFGRRRKGVKFYVKNVAMVIFARLGCIIAKFKYIYIDLFPPSKKKNFFN